MLEKKYLKNDSYLRSWALAGMREATDFRLVSLSFTSSISTVKDDDDDDDDERAVFLISIPVCVVKSITTRRHLGSLHS